MGIGLGAVAVAAVLWFSGTMDAWEKATWSVRVRSVASRSAATGSIKLILLDQASLDWGSRENGWAWPWPREVYAAILDFCSRSEARSVAFDLLLTEPSLYGVDDDVRLGAAAKRTPGFVGALALSSLANAGTRVCDPHLDEVSGGLRGRAAEWTCDGVNDPATRCLQAVLAARVLSLPVEEALPIGVALGNVAELPDPDGVYRRVSLLRFVDGFAVPSLGLAAYLQGEGKGIPVKLERHRLKIGKRVIPLDDKGRAILRFSGPWLTYESFSAAAVIQSELQMREGREPVIDPSSLRGCDVLFGLSAPGLLDLRSTPASPSAPGVAVHATVLDDLRADGFLRDSPMAVTWVAIAICAVCVAGLVLSCRTAWQSLASIAISLSSPPLLSAAGYAFGWWFPLVPAGAATAGALTGSLIWNFATEGRQRRFLKNAFRQYLSPHVVEELVADPRKLRLGGERRVLTIFFSDFAGFTSISESLAPELLTGLLNDILSDLTEIILDEDGTLDKYEGDAIIAFWNAPLEVSDHAARACRAALRCQHQLAARRHEFRLRTGHELNMRIGLHTGPVVVGNMGSRQRFNYTVLGDAANLASRLEGANKAFQTAIMISDATRLAAGSSMRVRELGSIQVVGRQAPVNVFELLGWGNDGSNDQAYERFHAALRLCRAGDMASAAAAFAALAEDPVAQCYAKRCAAAVAGNDEFRGVWNLTSK